MCQASLRDERAHSFGVCQSSAAEVLDLISIAETEAVVEPNGMADDFLGETMAMIERLPGFHRSSVANQRLT
jgi:hypothetical protein